MCGIAGWLTNIGSEPHPDVLERMADAIRHRGPDDKGIYRDPAAGLALAHLRLSIIDLSSASHQPMLDRGSGAALVYNGELYNFRELRSELEQLGHGFESRGDGEVVLKSFVQWGSTCFQRFAGMFAIAIWDPRDATLHLARDPLGMKPLYYTELAGGLAFASEVKAFRALPGFQFRPSDAGLRQYLEFGYVFDQDQAFLEGVFKVPPGFRMELRAGSKAQLTRYFSLPVLDPDDSRTEDVRLAELHSLLRQVTSEHLIADVPVGLLLSGGLDSSLIAALAAREAPLSTISMGFSDSPFDERPHARQVAAFIGSRHTEITITPQQVMQETISGAWVFDDLFADWGTITTRIMYRRCREQGLKVVLVGEGADELFGGYDVFRTPTSLGLWNKFRLYQRYSGRRHGRLFGEFRRVMGEYLDVGGQEPFNAVRLFETCRQLPNQYVMKVDKASMAESMEARAPFLDRRVAEFALRTPREWLLRDGENKYLLRALGRREKLLPDAINQRAKFGAPLAASWMDENAEFRRFARDRLLGGIWCRRLGLHRAMSDYFDGGRRGYGSPHALSIFSNLAWRLLLLELWSEHYLEREAA